LESKNVYLEAACIYMIFMNWSFWKESVRISIIIKTHFYGLKKYPAHERTLKNAISRKEEIKQEVTFHQKPRNRWLTGGIIKWSKPSAK